MTEPTPPTTPDPKAEPPLHVFGSNRVCIRCGMTAAESDTLGPRCVFESVHVNKPAGLVDSTGQPVADPDKPDGVFLWDGAEGVKIPNPGDVMAWVLATGHLTTRALMRLGQLFREHKRTDLKYVIRWAISPLGDELHCEMKVRLP
jgi:hypothetical protein